MDNILVTHIKIFSVILLSGVVCSGCKDSHRVTEHSDTSTQESIDNLETKDDAYYIDGINFSSPNVDDIDKSVKPRSSISVTQPVQPVPKARISATAVEKARLLQESLNNTYARKAANFRDVCPKLVVKKVDSNKIARHGELLKDKYCDYYIYPLPEDRIDVTSKGTALQRYLVSPFQHNFADGSYLVETADKYVIRVKSAKKQHKPINYDIVITIEGNEGEEDDSNL